MSHKKHGAPPLAENREKRPPPAKQPNQKKVAERALCSRNMSVIW
uniref:Uncharacterized protein n=1 Tax=Brassica oleracea TaxID=3712 RepID=A0A3P6EAW2_BRAOL|nr:unnamed protein product [Brassica oleracea]